VRALGPTIARIARFSPLSCAVMRLVSHFLAWQHDADDDSPPTTCLVEES
jgi:hypothetical protein